MIAAYHQPHPQVPLSPLCRARGANRSWFYAGSVATEPSQEAVALRARIEGIVLELPGYGYRRVTEQLQKEGWSVNHKRMLRILRQESLLCQLKTRFVLTTNSEYACRTYPNLLKGTELIRPDQAWQAGYPRRRG
jgi:transposase InsO family protein